MAPQARAPMGGEAEPVVFATGCSRNDIPDRIGALLHCEKPVAMERVAQALGGVLG